MRRTLRLSIAWTVIAVVLIAVPRAASAQEGEKPQESPTIRGDRGLEVGLGPVLVMPSRDNGPWGAGIRFDGRYGFKVGPAVLAPGIRVAGYSLSERFIGLATPTVRVTVPLGPIAPYLVGGVGGGWVTNDSEGGAGLLAGGGFTLHLGSLAALGAEASYQTVTGTFFRSWTIGPSISLFGG